MTERRERMEEFKTAVIPMKMKNIRGLRSKNRYTYFQWEILSKQNSLYQIIPKKKKKKSIK